MNLLGGIYHDILTQTTEYGVQASQETKTGQPGLCRVALILENELEDYLSITVQFMNQCT